MLDALSHELQKAQMDIIKLKHAFIALSQRCAMLDALNDELSKAQPSTESPALSSMNAVVQQTEKVVNNDST
jgi:hypothetical protein